MMILEELRNFLLRTDGGYTKPLNPSRTKRNIFGVPMMVTDDEESEIVAAEVNRAVQNYMLMFPESKSRIAVIPLPFSNPGEYLVFNPQEMHGKSF